MENWLETLKEELLMKPITLDFTDAIAVEALFNKAFRHPRRTYVVQPVDAAQAMEWLQEHTWMTNFTWCAGAKSFEQRLQDVGPLHCGQLIHLDTLYESNRCGWAAGDYHCDYPNDGEAVVCEEEACEVCAELGQDEQRRPRHKRRCFSLE